MHINEDHFIAEIINPDTGEVLPDGTKGELVFTSLDKEAFPLLRYRTRDICVLTRGKCSCGRTLVKMAKTMPNYQIVVDRVNNTDTFDILVEVDDSMFSDTVKTYEDIQKTIANELKSVLGIRAKIRLVEPKSIPRSEGKAVRVIDKRKLHG
jgi:phenylacetate-CoA ligase